MKRPGRPSRLPAALLALIVLLFAAAAGLWWWSGVEGSLEWVLRRITASQPVTIEGVRGALRSEWHIRRIVWERAGLTIEAQDVNLSWEPLWLLEGIVKVRRLDAAALRVTDRRPPSGQPFQLPQSLMARTELQLDALAIGRLEWNAAQSYRAENLRARYWFDGKAHWFGVQEVRLYGGRYGGHGSLGALAPFPLDASLTGKLAAEVPGIAPKLPLEFTAKLRGPVADLQAQGWLRAAIGPAGTQATQATATARITPWAAQPVPQAQAQLAGLDLANLWPQAPRTRLAGTVQVAPAGTATWQASADLRNELAGPWDRSLLPIEQLEGRGQWRAGTALVQELDARIGGGRLQATGQWRSGSNDWTLQGQVSGIDPGALHSRMAAVPVSGRVDVQQQEGAIAFDLGLRSSGRGSKAAPRRGGTSEAAAAVRALELRQVIAQGRWAGGRLSLPKLQLRTRDASLLGALELQPQRRAGSGHLQLRAPGVSAQASGELAEARGRGTLRIDAKELARAQRWAQRLPGMPDLRSFALAGSANLRLAWQGGWRDPVVQAALASPALEIRTAGDAAAAP